MARGWSSEATASTEVDRICICFKSQDGDSNYYKVEGSAKIQKLVQAFCNKKQIEYKTTNFIFNGKRLPYGGTVAEAGLMNGDEIQVVNIQSSG